MYKENCKLDHCALSEYPVDQLFILIIVDGCAFCQQDY